MERLIGSVLCAALIAWPTGCSDDASSGGGSGGDAGSGGEAGSGAAGGSAGAGGTGGTGGSGDTVLLSAIVTRAPSIDDMLFGGPPFEEVELCEADTTNCSTTNALGFASIMVPANQEVTYTLSIAGYVPYFVGDVSDPPAITGTWPMISDALMEAEFQRIGLTWPSDSFGLLALGVSPRQPGVTWKVLNETTEGYYMDAECVAHRELAATTNCGRGGHYEVGPGTHVVEFGGTATNCSPGIAWPGTAANQIRVPVRALHIGWGNMQCDDP